jgi:hypothetical protein
MLNAKPFADLRLGNRYRHYHRDGTSSVVTLKSDPEPAGIDRAGNPLLGCVASADGRTGLEIFSINAFVDAVEEECQ